MARISRSKEETAKIFTNYVDIEPSPEWIECLHQTLINSYLEKESPMRYGGIQNHTKKQPIKKATIGLFVIEYYQPGMIRKKLIRFLMEAARKNSIPVNESSLRTTVSRYQKYRKSANLPL